MSVEKNKALVRRYFEAIDARRVPAVVDEFLGIDFVSHSPSPGLRRRAVSLSERASALERGTRRRWRLVSDEGCGYSAGGWQPSRNVRLIWALSPLRADAASPTAPGTPFATTARSCPKQAFPLALLLTAPTGAATDTASNAAAPSALHQTSPPPQCTPTLDVELPVVNTCCRCSSGLATPTLAGGAGTTVFTAKRVPRCGALLRVKGMLCNDWCRRGVSNG